MVTATRTRANAPTSGNAPTVAETSTPPEAPDGVQASSPTPTDGPVAPAVEASATGTPENTPAAPAAESTPDAKPKTPRLKLIAPTPVAIETLVVGENTYRAPKVYSNRLDVENGRAILVLGVRADRIVQYVRIVDGEIEKAEDGKLVAREVFAPKGVVSKLGARLQKAAEAQPGRRVALPFSVDTSGKAMKLVPLGSDYKPLPEPATAKK